VANLSTKICSLYSTSPPSTQATADAEIQLEVCTCIQKICMHMNIYLYMYMCMYLEKYTCIYTMILEMFVFIADTPMMMIAFITFKSSLVPLFEGL